MSVMEVSYVEARGVRTRVRRAGEGPPVVLLHGWGGRLESMIPIADCLNDRFLTVALDLPGFGESQLPPEPWGSEEYAQHVAVVLETFGIARAHFVGHSFGAKASLCLAAARPETVDKLVVAGSPGLRIPPSLGARVKKAASRVARSVGGLGAPGRALRDAIYRRVASRDYRDAGELRSILVKVVNEDLADALRKIAAPTLLVWGVDDDDVPVAVARRMEKLIPDAGLVTLEGAGHFSYLDQPARFCRIVRHFFLGEEAR